ncbi:toll/interleukin-1 receptor domain-containing protein [Pseudofrankia saprophytica]|uniref:toll/interleukin-1 receptor domain-containing protein n=1 Tax=Pseudofrankia saprophytica TaxID=298655 RepID=UPI001E3E558E|nr:toll/interleukin-1 receptor domain-containing protein [Pseudofrankia saprophytica]
MSPGEPYWDFFVVHACDDEAWANWVAWQLEEAGYRVLVEAWDNVPGSRWTVTLDLGVEYAAHVVALLSPAYLREPLPPAVEAALARDPDGAQRRLVPILVAPCQPRGLLRALTPISLVGLAADAGRARLRAQAAAVVAGRTRPADEPAFPGGSGLGPAHLGVRPPVGTRPEASPEFPGPWPARPAPPLAPATAARTGGGTGPLRAACDELAVEIETTWRAESRRLGLNTGLLPVTWAPADPDLFQDWADLRNLAQDAVLRSAPETWAAGPHELAGGPNDLDAVLRRVPTRRLVVLGEPGTGKSTLLLRALLDLLRRRRQDGGLPVPVLLRVSSWDPDIQPSFDAWLVGQIAGHATPRARSDPGLARRLLDEGLLLLLLDGFDEIPAAHRRGALGVISHYVDVGQELILTSRAREFRDAVHPPGGTGTPLTGAAGVELRPLGRAAVAAFLGGASPRPRADPRWEPILRALDETPPPPAVEALRTPLALTLARAVYAPAGGDVAGGAQPAELLRRDLYPTSQAVLGRLLDGAIPAAYRPGVGEGTPRRRRWTPERAESWLTFLAAQQQHAHGRRPDIAWWRLAAAVPRSDRTWLVFRAAGVFWALAVVVFAVVVLAVRLAYRDFTPVLGWPFPTLLAGLAGWGGAVSGLVFGYGGAMRSWGTRAPARGIGWSRPRGGPRWRRPAAVGLYGAVGALLPAIAAGTRPRAGIGLGELAGAAVAAGLVVGLVSWALRGVRAVEGVAASPGAGPGPSLAADRRAFRWLAVIHGFGWVASVGLLFALWAYGWSHGSTARSARVVTVFAVVVGLPCALGIAAGRTAYVPYAVVRRSLARRGRLPRDLAAFLADAAERTDGLLRQVGPVYQFRHIELQRRLARHADDPLATRLAAEVAADLRGRPLPGSAAPLAVRWRAADPSLTQPWALLRRLAASWDVATSARWAARPADLAGTGRDLVATLRAVPTARLVVLGGEGSGRTTLLAGLALDLAAARLPADPVPVLLPLGSWDPDRHDLGGWLEIELRRRHTWLAATDAEISGARVLVDSGKIMPLLDGLEELAPAVRARALTRINEWLAEGARIVVSSTPEAFAAAVRSGAGEVRLRGAAAVEIRPLDLAEAAACLVGSQPGRAPGPGDGHRGERWAPVLAAARRQPRSPVAGALTTPLTLALACAVYEDATGDQSVDADAGTGPGELLDENRFATFDAIRDHLARTYLRQKLDSPGGGSARRGSPHGRRRALAFLAHNLDTRVRSTSLAWWEIQSAVPWTLLAAELALAGLPTYYGFGFHAPVLAVAYLLVAFALGAALNRAAAAPGRAPRMEDYARFARIVPRPRRAAPTARRYGPRAVWRRCRLNTLAGTPVPLVAGYLLVTLYVTSVDSTGTLDRPPWWSLTLAAVGFGAVGTLGLTAWGRYTLARCWLARRRRLPADLMAVLEDATALGVLRQTGDVWEFRHPVFQRQLTAAWTGSAPDTRPPAA